MIAGGVSWVIFGLSHLFFPSVLNWGVALSGLPPASVFGITVSNQAFVYLLNADLFLYDILLGAISILFAAPIRKGKRMAAAYSIGLGIYFVFRSGLQVYYFGISGLDVFQAAVSLAYAAIYLFPLTSWQEFSEE